MAVAPSSLDALLRPLDRARTALFLRALEVRTLRGILLQKQRRIPSFLLAHATAAFVLSILAPTFLLVLGPLLLGVPHVLSEVRHLVLRPAWTGRSRALLLGGVSVLVALRLAELAGLPELLNYELPLAAAWIAGCALSEGAAHRVIRLLVVVACAVGLGVAGRVAPATTQLALAHAHNLLAVAAWALVFSSAPRRALGFLLLVSSAAILLIVSPLAWLGFSRGVPENFGLHSFVAAEHLAPFAAAAPLALGVVASYAFLQSVHYGVWLYAVPQEDARGQGTLSFRMSFRNFEREVGRGAMLLVATLVLAVPLCGLVRPLRTQSIYLSLATFHGYLELAALALWWVNPKAMSQRRCS